VDFRSAWFSSSARNSAWFFFIIRFYLMPWLLGYTVMGMLSFSLESEFASGLNWFIGEPVN
jgi:hypothetical protein